nr:AEC family transporter [Sphaerochaetaceae bacterium]
WVYTSLSYMSRVGTPVCLIALGGQFEISDVPAFKKELIAGTIMRLVMAPLIGFAVVFIAHHYGYLELNPTYMGVFVAAFGAPIAVSSAAMASQMDADEVLAGQIVIWTCIFSMFTVFTMAVLFRALGLL